MPRDAKIKITTEGDAKGAEKVAKGMERVEQAARKVDSGNKKASKSSRNLGGAVLEASRAFEDLQYGIRGVLNNIPGLLMQLGVRAGLTGVISAATVAVVVLYDKLSKAKSKFENLKKPAEDSRRELELFTTANQRAAEQADFFARSQRNAASATEGVVAALRQQAQQQAAIEDLQLGLEVAQIDARVASGEISGTEGARMKAQAQKASRGRKFSSGLSALQGELEARAGALPATGDRLGKANERRLAAESALGSFEADLRTAAGTQSRIPARERRALVAASLQRGQVAAAFAEGEVSEGKMAEADEIYQNAKKAADEALEKENDKLRKAYEDAAAEFYAATDARNAALGDRDAAAAAVSNYVKFEGQRLGLQNRIDDANLRAATAGADEGALAERIRVQAGRLPEGQGRLAQALQDIAASLEQGTGVNGRMAAAAEEASRAGANAVRMYAEIERRVAQIEANNAVARDQGL